MTETVFQRMDRVRRYRGDRLEAFGLARNETPNEVILETSGVRLRAYRGAAESRSALLIVPAPIKRYYIWDISAENSVVAHAGAEGLQVYVAEWTEAPSDFGVSEYVELLRRCVEQIQKDGMQSLHVATHSLGGILSVAYAARHPQDVTSLVLLETPLHFDQTADTFRPWLRMGPSGHQIAEQLGSVPGSLLSTLAAAAYPVEFEFERFADWAASWLDARNLDTHMRVERWAMDELPLPGALYAEVVDELYRQDALMRGEFLVSDHRVGPADLHVPLCSVFDPRGQVVPPESIIPFHDAAASANKLLLSYPGEVGVALRHVGALVGREAHQSLWPRIFAWQRDMAVPLPLPPLQGEGWGGNGVLGQKNPAEGRF